MKFHKSKQIDIYYQYKKRSSLKKTILFIHGWGLNGTSWDKFADYFYKKGYATLIVDLRGHGLSTKPKNKSQYSLNIFANDILSLLKYLHISNCIAVGHSMGGMILQTAYNKKPTQWEQLIFINTNYRNPLKDAHAASFLKLEAYLESNIEFFTELQKPKQRKKRLHYSQIVNLPVPIAFAKGALHNGFHSIGLSLEAMMKFDNEKNLSKITIPTLILSAEEDMETPIHVAKRMHRLIKKSKLIVIKNHNHHMHMINPRLILKHMNNFLRSNS